LLSDFRGTYKNVSIPARELTDKFTEDYNKNHVHKSLANMTPLEFLNHHYKKIPIIAVGF